MPLTLYLEAPDASDSKHAEQIGVKYKGRDAVNLTFIELAISTTLQNIEDVEDVYRYTFLSHDPADNRVDPAENIVNCTASLSPNEWEPTYSWSYGTTLLHLQNPQGDTEKATIELYADANTAAPDGRTADLNETISVDVDFEEFILERELEIHQTDVDYVRQTYVDVVNNGTPCNRVPARDEFTKEDDFQIAMYPNLPWAGLAGLECHGGGTCNNHEHQMLGTAASAYQAACNRYGGTISLSSMYRCPRHNVTMDPRGAANSDHTYGNAFDFDAGPTSVNWAYAEAAEDSGIDPERILLYSQGSATMYKNVFNEHEPPYNDEYLPPGWTAITHGHAGTN